MLLLAFTFALQKMEIAIDKSGKSISERWSVVHTIQDYLERFSLNNSSRGQTIRHFFILKVLLCWTFRLVFEKYLVPVERHKMKQNLRRGSNWNATRNYWKLLFMRSCHLQSRTSPNVSTRSRFKRVIVWKIKILFVQFRSYIEAVDLDKQTACICLQEIPSSKLQSIVNHCLRPSW